MLRMLFRSAGCRNGWPPDPELRRPDRLTAYIFALVAVLLAACAATQPAPTSIPAPTSVPRPALLDVVPLQVGNTRSFRVTVRDERFGENERRVINWSGIASETITLVRQDEGAWIYTARFHNTPATSGTQIDAISRTERYRIADNRFSGPGLVTQLVFNWPLEVGQRWDVAGVLQPQQVVHIWKVEAQEDVATPAGDFADCYRLRFKGNVGDSYVWLCPGAGVVRAEYQLFGSTITYSEVWELYSIHQ